MLVVSFYLAGVALRLTADTKNCKTASTFMKPCFT
ncbi:hypothetical protein O185_06660 [Photorhabdus temperata J3]|uniref:Uncharacterized protein n=1 Tax=Photorhabdus temperata J3 TaxID=1389415 RepID=U7R1F0_PHOTE|nr:hypothetical protein O185_06660 [Photorhabdus temperata J3]